MSLEAWIDVGGTFTDCLVRTVEGKILRTKTLSSSRVPVSMVTETGNDQPLKSLRFAELKNDCPQFWCEAELRGFDSAGQQIASATVIDFSSGSIALDRPIDSMEVSRFELFANCEAPVLAVRRILQVPLSLPLPAMTVRLGTTRGTNALLTRNGAKVALLVTSPFEQLLEIGDQTRPELFALNINKPPQLTTIQLGIHERLAADGSLIQALDVDQAKEQLQRAKQIGCQSLAISLMHSYRNPSHELALANLAREFEFDHVSVSHSLASVVEFVARTQTAVVDAYLSPIIRSYFRRLCEQFGGKESVELLVMTSAGGLVDWREYSGKDCVLSGPAGGAVALSQIRQTLKQPIIGLDMGGTSTDVCRAGEQTELQYESTKAGVRILTPTLPIETVAAGGGSICWFDGVSLRVGPQSAGAYPGPACYGRGGPLTITDLNIVSGRIPLEQFPFPIDIEASWKRIDELLQQIESQPSVWSRELLIDGLRRLATQQMAEAVRTVSIKQGEDPRDHALVGFGGAAGQHICEIAESLGITSVVDHEDAGLLSAVGMGLACRRFDQAIPVYQPLADASFDDLLIQAYAIANQLNKKLNGRQSTNEVSGNKSARPVEYCSVATLDAELRYQGTDSTLTIAIEGQVRGKSTKTSSETWETSSDLHSQLGQRFNELHQQRYGYLREHRQLELVALRVSVQSSEQRSLLDLVKVRSATKPELERSNGQPIDSEASNAIPTFLRSSLRPGDSLSGPLIVLNSGSTLFVDPSWHLSVEPTGMLRLKHSGKNAALKNEQSEGEPTKFDPVLRDCYAQRLSAIATQMGYVLQQTAVSVNIKQRRDFSCAVFDGCGNLLANAPHVPVHLGAMGVTVRAILDCFPEMQPGDSFLCNDPYCGGSHLPDLTLVQPVFESKQTTPRFFLANRAHHADIGGVAPGSMSIMATRLEQEGVVISPFRLTSGGRSCIEQLKQMVDASPHPPRNWIENLADLNAQQAACNRGNQLLQDYAQSIGWTAMKANADHLLDAGQYRMSQFIQHELEPMCGLTRSNSLKFNDALEDGTAICVCISRTGNDRLRFDFTGTGPASATNLNANPSIVTAAVLYVLRTLVNDELPLNEGVLRTVDLIIPTSVLNPQPAHPAGLSPAVAAGNVETSQRVVDTLLGAFQAAAASQGTMNNTLFGNSSFGFYETICGGSGATATGDGASAVHTHMTNTRLTDPEVLELRYPVRLLEFRIRAGSGGNGHHRGGDGIVRTFQFLEPVTLSLLTSRRSSQPFGIQGGSPGLSGENWLKKPNENWLKLPSSCQTDLAEGSILSILTPGGGGFGRF
ncbi:MAG: hydantoinase B/oxoprolinase family protein [Pirellulales bacterium]